MTLLAILYYSIREYNIEEAIKKIECRLLKLKDKIMNGDSMAASLAWVQLEEKDRLTIESKKYDFYKTVANMIFISTEIISQIKNTK